MGFSLCGTLNPLSAYSLPHTKAEADAIQIHNKQQREQHEQSL